MAGACAGICVIGLLLDWMSGTPDHTVRPREWLHAQLSATGALELDETNPAASRVQATIPAGTVETGMEPRDGHLRSADFLDVEHFPTLDFVSTSIAPSGSRWDITGDLTIRGVASPVVLDAEILGIVTGMDGRRHAGFEATTRFRRSDWGLTWNVGLETGGWLVSDEIAIELEVAADEIAGAPADDLAGAASA